MKVQESVDVPVPPEIDVEEREHAVLSAAKVTVPVNPFRGEMLIVEVPGEFTVTGTVDGLAAIEKSGAGVTVNATVAV